MNFSQKLRKAMLLKNVTQTELSKMTGLGKSSISQYLSGKNKPNTKALNAIATALGVFDEWLDDEVEEKGLVFSSKVLNLPVPVAAKLMGKNPQFIRIGIRSGSLPIGRAVKTSENHYDYYISPVKFAQETGVDVDLRLCKEIKL